MWEPGSYHIPAGPRLAKTVRLWSMKRVGRAFGRYCRFGRIFGSTDQNKKKTKNKKKKYIYIYIYIYILHGTNTGKVPFHKKKNLMKKGKKERIKIRSNIYEQALGMRLKAADKALLL